ncbi:MAG: hypothetical protein ACYCUW_01805 [bacterium]
MLLICDRNGKKEIILQMSKCPANGFKPKGIITLCGSTRFFDTFREVNAMLTAQGYIVLSISVIIDKNKQDDETLSLKKILDELHKEKIVMSDAIFVIDVDGYIGESTNKEIEFAKKHNKQIRYYSKEII